MVQKSSFVVGVSNRPTAHFRVVVQFENLSHIETIGSIDHPHRLCVSAYVFYVPMWFKNLSYLSGFQTVPLPVYVT